MSIRGRGSTVRTASFIFTMIAMLALTAIILFVAIGSLSALRSKGFGFFFENRWAYRNESFGAAAMLYGTAAVSLIALVLAAPVGIGAAIFTAEIASRRVRLTLKTLIELLAGIPSVVYGLLGVLFLRNWMASLYERIGVDALSGDTILTAGVLLAVMILPTVATLVDDALQSVPARVRDASRGLGLTRAETTMYVVIPQASQAILAALMLALGRALGETIAVFLVIGRADNRMPESLMALQPLLEAGQTITSKLGGAETNIAAGDPHHTSAILALALVLLVFVLGMTISADILRRRVTRVIER